MLNEFCRFSFIVFFLRCSLIESVAWNHIPASIIPIQFQLFLFPEDEIAWSLNCLLSVQRQSHIQWNAFSWEFYILHWKEEILLLLSVQASDRFFESLCHIQILYITVWTDSLRSFHTGKLRKSVNIRIYFSISSIESFSFSLRKVLIVLKSGFWNPVSHITFTFSRHCLAICLEEYIPVM